MPVRKHQTQYNGAQGDKWTMTFMLCNEDLHSATRPDSPTVVSSCASSSENHTRIVQFITRSFLLNAFHNKGFTRSVRFQLPRVWRGPVERHDFGMRCVDAGPLWRARLAWALFIITSDKVPIARRAQQPEWICWTKPVFHFRVLDAQLRNIAASFSVVFIPTFFHFTCVKI